MKIETVSILNSKIARMTMREVLEWVRMMIDQRKPRQIVTANAEILYSGFKNKDHRSLLDRVDLITADGIGAVLASRIAGRPVPERVAGIDLAQELFVLAEEKSWKIYFLGAAEEVVQKAVLNVLSKHTRLNICGYQHGYFTEEERDSVALKIREAEPHILLVAMGFPQQELFIQEQLKAMQVPVSIGVGGSFDVMAGTARRAPAWMRRIGFEWLYRLIEQPSRAGRMLNLPRFIIAVIMEKYLHKTALFGRKKGK